VAQVIGAELSFKAVKLGSSFAPAVLPAGGAIEHLGFQTAFYPVLRGPLTAIKVPPNQ
jgi:hypothetical protein